MCDLLFVYLSLLKATQVYILYKGNIIFSINKKSLGKLILINITRACLIADLVFGG